MAKWGEPLREWHHWGGEPSSYSTSLFLPLDIIYLFSPGEEGHEKLIREIKAQVRSCTASTGMLKYFDEGNGTDQGN